MAAHRNIMRIELTAKAKKKIQALGEQHGMTQVAMMSRLVEWAARQSETIQGAALGLYPQSISPDVAKLILEKMTK
jgi:hypothetical protein